MRDSGLDAEKPTFTAKHFEGNRPANTSPSVSDVLNPFSHKALSAEPVDMPPRFSSMDCAAGRHTPGRRRRHGFELRGRPHLFLLCSSSCHKRRVAALHVHVDEIAGVVRLAFMKRSYSMSHVTHLHV